MPENETLEEAIRRNASGPKSAEVDGQKVEQHSSGLKITKLCHSGA